MCRGKANRQKTLYEAAISQLHCYHHKEKIKRAQQPLCSRRQSCLFTCYTVPREGEGALTAIVGLTKKQQGADHVKDTSCGHKSARHFFRSFRRSDRNAVSLPCTTSTDRTILRQRPAPRASTHARVNNKLAKRKRSLGDSRLATIRRTDSGVTGATLAGLGSVVLTETRLQTGWSVVRILVLDLTVLLTVQTGPGILLFNGYPGVDGRIILRCIFSKWDVRVWTGSSWLRLGTGGGHC
jgi:hypothetical protein